MQPKLTLKIVTVKKPSSGHFLMIERTWRQLKNQFIIALEQTHKPAFVNGRSYICAMIFFSRSYLKTVKIIAGTPTLVKANQYWHKTHLQLFYRELKIFLSDHKIAGKLDKRRHTNAKFRLSQQVQYDNSKQTLL